MPVKVLKSFYGAIKVRVADIDIEPKRGTANSGDLGGYARAFRGAG